MKLRVIQLIDSLNTGGAEVLAVNIANNLDQENYVSYICSTRKEGILKDKLEQHVNYLFLNRKKAIDFLAIFRLVKYIKKNEIAIIHAHSSSFFIAFLVKLCYPKVRLFWHDHYGNSEFLHKRDYKILKLASLKFEAIIAVNEKLKSWSELKLKCKHVYFVNNFAHLDTTDNITKLKGDKGKRIVHLAGFRAQKDHLNLLEAFKLVLLKHHEWTLHLIGKDYDDEYSKSIAEFIKKNNIHNNVFLYGVCSDIKNILRQSDIGVLSSKSEGLPIALLEYGLEKLCVVVTDVGECSAVLNQVNSDFLVEANNSILFAEGVNKIIDFSDKEKEMYGRKLFDLVELNYSKNKFMEKISTLYSIF